MYTDVSEVPRRKSQSCPPALWTIDNAVVVEQIRRRARDASSRKVSRTGHNHPVGLRQLASPQRGVGKNTQAQPGIDVPRYQIHDAVIHHKLQLNLWISVEKRAQFRNQVQARERKRGTSERWKRNPKLRLSSFLSDKTKPNRSSPYGVTHSTITPPAGGQASNPVAARTVPVSPAMTPSTGNIFLREMKNRELNTRAISSIPSPRS